MNKTQRKGLVRGTALLGGFVIILILMFSPIFNGKSPMVYLDNLYNSISKGSVYYIDQLAADSQGYRSKTAALSLKFNTAGQAEGIGRLLEKNGGEVLVTDTVVHLNTSLGDIMTKALADADTMFQNKGAIITEKYGYQAKLVMVDWWIAFRAIIKDLNKQKRFEDARQMQTVLTKGIECAYNYYGIQPVQIAGQARQVILSLCFYVLYTVWFGFAIMYMFIGLGFKLEH